MKKKNLLCDCLYTDIHVTKYNSLDTALTVESLSMMVADDLAPNRRRDICNIHENVRQLAPTRGPFY